MNSRIAASIVAVSMAVVGLGAAEKVDIRKLELKSLPVDVYADLKPGKRASLLWRAPGFLLGSPYAVEKVEWLAADRNGSLSDYLTKELQSLGQKDAAQYSVQVRVTKYVDPVVRMIRRSVSSELLIEAVVFDKSGAMLAAMVTLEKGSVSNGHVSPVNGLADKVIAALDSELMKGR